MAVALGAILLDATTNCIVGGCHQALNKSEYFRRTTRITCSGLSSVSDRLRVPSGKDC